MTRLALSFVQTPSIADEVVQETWLAVIRGLDGFEARCSLKTWIFRILVNRAKTRGVSEQRTTPFSSLTAPEDDQGPTVDRDRFIAEREAFGGYWSLPPSRFFELPEERLLAAETRALIGSAISELPARQQQVIRLRDVEGWEAAEVCEGLGISEANQRVLLHRARARVRTRWRRTSRSWCRMSYEDLPCNDFVELATDYLEGSLTAGQRLVVERHLAFCAPAPTTSTRCAP